jgi:hypothetical protein
MKKSFFIAVFTICTCLLLSSGSFAQNKIGHLNSDELLRSMPETDSINKILTGFAKSPQCDQGSREGE